MRGDCLIKLVDTLGRKARDLAMLGRQTLMVGRRVDVLRLTIDEMKREQRTLLGALSLPHADLWTVPPALETAGPPFRDALPGSTLCREDSFRQPWFQYWLARLGLPLRYHRKLWEFAFIVQALTERGAVVPGARGLGFGVGEEPLTAFFAAQDCTVTATDIAAEAAVDAGWAETSQHATSLEALRASWVCPDTLFDRNVAFQPCDMNAIDPDLRGYDFCWSACAFEHLGSIEKGLAFVENSLATLKPGGWAVHTTELNLSSNDDTPDNGLTVLFRRRDFEALAARLTAQGHKVAPLDFTPGSGQVDRYIDVPPYREEPHLRLLLEGYATTSFGIIVQKGG